MKLEKRFSSFKNYCYQDGFKHRNIRDIKNLFIGIAFNQSIDEDFYKPIRPKSVFNGNHIEYESKGDKNEIYHQKNIFVWSDHISAI